MNSSKKSSVKEDKIKTEIIQFSKKYYKKHDELHGINHIKRVLHIANLIHLKEGGDWGLIEVIGWLHDIGRKFEKEKGKHHAIISENMAKSFLKLNKITKSEIERISHGILSHSFSIGGKPKTLEAKIISDADKIDALGAIGIFRACVYQDRINQGIQSVLDHCDEKLLKLKDQMQLSYSKKLAKKRTYRIRRFQQDIIEELTGIDI